TRNVRRGGSLHIQLRSCLDRIVFMRRYDTEKVAFTDELHTRDVLQRTLVDRDDWSAEPESRLPARPHDPAVEHSRNPDVVHVGVSAGDLVRDVDPRHRLRHDLVLTDRLRAEHARKKPAVLS